MNRFRRSLHLRRRPWPRPLTIAVALAAPPAERPAPAASAGLWLLDEGSGQVANDLSFNGNRGQLGSTAGVDAERPDVDLPAARCSSSSAPPCGSRGAQSVRMPDAPSLEPDGVTVLARVRSTGAGAFRYVMSKGAFQCENASYGLYTGESGGLVFYVSDGTRRPPAPPTQARPLGRRAGTRCMGAFDGSDDPALRRRRRRSAPRSPRR